MSRAALLVFAALGTALAQVQQPNAQGVVMGHVHLVVKDPDAMRSFWTQVLGAVPAQHATLDGVRAGSVFVWIRKGEPQGGTGGTCVRDVGLAVRNLDDVLTRAAAGGFHGRRSGRNSAVLLAPEGLMLELVEMPELQQPLGSDHLHMIVPNAVEAREWYAARFGQRIPGIRLDFVSGDSSVAQSQGRVVDHIGFEITKLQDFCNRLSAAGTKFDTPFRDAPDLKLGLAFLADPWGTKIELTEGLLRTTR